MWIVWIAEINGNACEKCTSPFGCRCSRANVVPTRCVRLMTCEPETLLLTWEEHEIYVLKYWEPG